MILTVGDKKIKCEFDKDLDMWFAELPEEAGNRILHACSLEELREELDNTFIG
jgi:hypothetical protein